MNPKPLSHCMIPLLFCIVLSESLGCKGPKGDSGPTGPQGPSDRQVILVIGSFSAISTIATDTTWQTGDTLRTILPRFNILNYIGVDSVVFVALVGSQTDSVLCSVRLFNLTDAVPIDSTQISNQGPGFAFVHTRNILNLLPRREITLAVQIKGNLLGRLIQANQFTLYLFRP